MEKQGSLQLAKKQIDFEQYSKVLKPSIKCIRSSVQNAELTETDETIENFKCLICTLLIFNPVECVACQNIFCAECISDWQKKGKKDCPMCRQKLQTKEANRLIGKLLLEQKLQGCPMKDCQLANQTIKVEKLKQHLEKECGKITVQCYYSCGQSFNREDWETHLGSCQKAQLKCDKCEQTIVYKEKDSHDCLKNVVNLVKSQQIKIDQLQEIIEKMQQEIAMLQLQQHQSKGNQQPLRNSVRVDSKYMNGKQIYKLNNKYYCNDHFKILDYMDKSGTPFRSCDCCMTRFQDIAIQQNQTNQQLMRYECRSCDLDICEPCMNSQKPFSNDLF